MTIRYHIKHHKANGSLDPSTYVDPNPKTPKEAKLSPPTGGQVHSGGGFAFINCGQQCGSTIHQCGGILSP